MKDALMNSGAPSVGAEDHLVACVEAGVRGTLEALAEAHPDQPLGAYALITDDGLSGLGHLAVSVADLAAGDAELLFVPNDWPHDEGAHHPSCKVIFPFWHVTPKRGHRTHSTVPLTSIEYVLSRQSTQPVCSLLTTDPTSHGAHLAAFDELHC